jgi:GH25 family lysozyme M1 (1,4-beta-N-acetylmuramidase)
VSGYGISGPIAIDTEYVDDSEARTFNLDITSRTDSVISFCDTVAEAGYDSMIYANRNWFVQNLDLTRLAGYRLWVAHYVDTPDFPYLYNGWQYTESATIAGVQGNIDLNVWIDF